MPRHIASFPRRMRCSATAERRWVVYQRQSSMVEAQQSRASICAVLVGIDGSEMARKPSALQEARANLTP